MAADDTEPFPASRCRVSAGAGGLRAGSAVPAPALGESGRGAACWGPGRGWPEALTSSSLNRSGGAGCTAGRTGLPAGWSPRTPPRAAVPAGEAEAPACVFGDEGFCAFSSSTAPGPCCPGPQGSAGCGAGGAPSGHMGLLAESCCRMRPDRPVTQVFAVKVGVSAGRRSCGRLLPECSLRGGFLSC